MCGALRCGVVVWCSEVRCGGVVRCAQISPSLPSSERPRGVAATHRTLFAVPWVQIPAMDIPYPEHLPPLSVAPPPPSHTTHPTPPHTYISAAPSPLPSHPPRACGAVWWCGEARLCGRGRAVPCRSVAVPWPCRGRAVAVAGVTSCCCVCVDDLLSVAPCFCRWRARALSGQGGRSGAALVAALAASASASLSCGVGGSGGRLGRLGRLGSSSSSSSSGSSLLLALLQEAPL